MLHNLRIATALSAVLFLFVALFALGGAGGLQVMQYSRDWVERLGRGNIERAGDLSDAAITLFQARAMLTDAKTYMEGGMEEERDASLAQARSLLERAHRSYRAFAANPDEEGEGAGLYGAVLENYAALRDQALLPMVKAIEGWNGIVLNQLASGPLPKLSDEFLASVQRYQAYGRSQGEAGVAGVGRMLDLSLRVVLALCALALAVAVAARLVFVRAMLRPLAGAGRHFDRMADGDLTAALSLRGRNEVSALYEAMRRMQAGLVRAVAAVRGGVEEIHVGAREIAQGTADMSDRTSGQAGALQETAATMAELAGMVGRNAASAREASELAGAVAQTARRGGEAVQDMVQTMEGISDSSRRVADIVGVIDGIAFQTNILALNAAVEAARAGAEGKGFAVVANEVRALAQRSGQAAREIRDLIAEAGQRVDAGAAQATQAGATMRDLVDSVDRVSALIASISEASSEQAQGIAVVDAAVAQAERATQENAAVLEQAAAAAASLEEQAALLREAVAVFRIDAGEAARQAGDGHLLLEVGAEAQDAEAAGAGPQQLAGPQAVPALLAS